MGFGAKRARLRMSCYDGGIGMWNGYGYGGGNSMLEKRMQGNGWLQVKGHEDDGFKLSRPWLEKLMTRRQS